MRISYPGIGAVSVLNHYYGRDDIVLGAYKGEFGKYCDGSWVPGEYIYDLVNNFDSPVYRVVQLDLTPDIEEFHMLLERCHTEN